MGFHTGGRSRSYIGAMHSISSIYEVQLYFRDKRRVAENAPLELQGELGEEWAQKPIFRVKPAPHAAEKVEPAPIDLVGVVTL